MLLDNWVREVELRTRPSTGLLGRSLLPRRAAGTLDVMQRTAGAAMGQADDPLLGDYLDEWIRRRRNQVRPATIAHHESIVRNYLRHQLGSLLLSELDRRSIERVYGQLLESGARDGGPLSPRTVQCVHTLLNQALEDARLAGVVERNPAEHARTPGRHADAVELDDDLQVWTFAQAARFLASVEQHPLRALWHLALGTGARRGELVGLRWKDVDLTSRDLIVRRSLSVTEGVASLLRPKTSRGRRLAIGPSVVDALDRHGREQQARRTRAGETWQNHWGLVFTEPSGRYVHPSTLTTRFCRLVRRRDVPTIRLHDLRHTHASLLLRLGVPVKVISDRLGHASVTTTMDTYAHVLPPMDRDAADTLAEILREPNDH